MLKEWKRESEKRKDAAGWSEESVLSTGSPVMIVLSMYSVLSTDARVKGEIQCHIKDELF